MCVCVYRGALKKKKKRKLLRDIRILFRNALKEYPNPNEAQNFRYRLIMLVIDWMKTTWEDFNEKEIVLEELRGLKKDITKLCSEGVSKALIQKIDTTRE
ncbi:hypothetical protein RFI_09399, partial [Reticulomyxa filosa]